MGTPHKKPTFDTAMNRTTTLAAVLAMTLGAAACGTSQAAEPADTTPAPAATVAPTTTEPPTTTTKPASTDEEIETFLTNQIAGYPDGARDLFEIDGRTIVINGRPSGYLNQYIEDYVLNGADYSAATWARMTSTRAIDGTQTDSNAYSEIWWTYHPDQGLDIVIELSPTLTLKD